MDNWSFERREGNMKLTYKWEIIQDGGLISHAFEKSMYLLLHIAKYCYFYYYNICQKGLQLGRFF